MVYLIDSQAPQRSVSGRINDWFHGKNLVHPLYAKITKWVMNEFFLANSISAYHGCFNCASRIIKLSHRVSGMEVFK